MGVLKGISTTRLFNKFPHARKRLWANCFGARGYFVDRVEVYEEIIRQYVRP
jgi:putative transposase